jgi:hypothetical protein
MNSPEPTQEHALKETAPTDAAPSAPPAQLPVSAPEPPETRLLKLILFGPNGVRVGWSVMLFLLMTLVFMGILSLAAMLISTKLLHMKLGEFNATNSAINEATQVLGLLAAAAISALIERRRVLDYNLRGPSRVRHFCTGLVGGFLALSALVFALYEGHWLQFGPVSLSGAAIYQFGVLWGIGFLLTGLSEEGMVRCYMQFTLTRGVTYWWALGTVCAFSLVDFLAHGNGAGGVYLMAGLGVIPCFLLEFRQAPSARFWQAAWLTSTFFGWMHTGNKGETWVGIFSAAAIGFVFCVSIRQTGSAWWAIGFHAAWDWAQTFFYGTADSGYQPKGHFLTTSPIGDVFWSGGTDGPEGSILVVPTVLLTLLVILLVYRPNGTVSHAAELLPEVERAS